MMLPCQGTHFNDRGSQIETYGHTPAIPIFVMRHLLITFLVTEEVHLIGKHRQVARSSFREEHCVCEASHETGLLWGYSSCYDGMMTFACCHVPCLRSLTVVLELGHGWTGSFGYPHGLTSAIHIIHGARQFVTRMKPFFEYDTSMFVSSETKQISSGDRVSGIQV